MEIGQRIEKITPHKEENEKANYGTIRDKHTGAFRTEVYFVEWDDGNKYLVSEYDRDKTWRPLKEKS
jgi:hypothetical protein